MTYNFNFALVPKIKYTWNTFVIFLIKPCFGHEISETLFKVCREGLLKWVSSSSPASNCVGRKSPGQSCQARTGKEKRVILGYRSFGLRHLNEHRWAWEEGGQVFYLEEYVPSDFNEMISCRCLRSALSAVEDSAAIAKGIALLAHEPRLSQKNGKKAAKVVPVFCREEQGDYGITHSLAFVRPFGTYSVSSLHSSGTPFCAFFFSLFSFGKSTDRQGLHQKTRDRENARMERAPNGKANGKQRLA